MTRIFDAVIVGSGPAGVSAAFPLLDAGLRVLMVDGGKVPKVMPPEGSLLALRQTQHHQSAWMVGADFHALRNEGAVSPKLRTPTHAYVFEDFQRANRVEADSFIAVGSLARGGLSNAWGCGVARFSREELSSYPFSADALDSSYDLVARRMGISGANPDDLSSYFGLDHCAQPPIPLDSLQLRLYKHYDTHRASLIRTGFRMGRARVAALTQEKDGRGACDQSGLCMWGCARRALYSATEDLQALQRRSNFSYLPGFVVQQVVRESGYAAIQGSDAAGRQTILGRRILLAAGTLATTRLALQAVDRDLSLGMQSSPTAAFIVWVPRAWGRIRSRAFGMGQLAYTLDLKSKNKAFGSLFDTSGIPMAEFAKYIPLGKRFGVDLLSSLLSSCAVGNLFLPGRHMDAVLSLQKDGALQVKGDYSEEVPALMAEASARLRATFRRLGGWVLPGSFTIGKPGSDIHYAASFPMRLNPAPGETDSWGKVQGVDDIHIVDGACLSSLPAKSHTLTIMANADRIGRRVVAELRT